MPTNKVSKASAAARYCRPTPAHRPPDVGRHPHTDEQDSNRGFKHRRGGKVLPPYAQPSTFPEVGIPMPTNKVSKASFNKKGLASFGIEARI
jgi:hypothetical protein